LARRTALVTGGAGFIGSHLVDRLLADGWTVNVIDNLSSGRIKNILQAEKSKGFNFFEGDLCEQDQIPGAIRGCDCVFHMAADPVIRGGFSDPGKRDSTFRNNVLATRNLLEAMVTEGTEGIVFASSSVVYGEAAEVPTPEDYGPLKPISLYGASKLAGEGLVTAYSSGFGFRYWIFRFANVVGGRSGQGVIHDFISKLRADEGTLKILGDGRQRKSYLHVSDCVGAMLACMGKTGSDIFNLGTGDTLSVDELAVIVEDELGLQGVEHTYTGGRGGWRGDIPVTELDVGKLRAVGLRPKLNSEQAVRLATRELAGTG